MAVVTLRSPLRALADGNATLELQGSTVRDVLRALEHAYPRTTGWVLDEQGRVRRHVNVFVNGERTGEDAPLAPDDVVHVLPSISGGGGR